MRTPSDPPSKVGGTSPIGDASAYPMPKTRRVSSASTMPPAYDVICRLIIRPHPFRRKSAGGRGQLNRVPADIVVVVHRQYAVALAGRAGVDRVDGAVGGFEAVVACAAVQGVDAGVTVEQ